VVICTTLDGFEGCWLQIGPQPFSVPTQRCERGCNGSDVGNQLRDMINHSIVSQPFFLALRSCPVHYGPDFLWCRLDAIIVCHVAWDIELRVCYGAGQGGFSLARP